MSDKEFNFRFQRRNQSHENSEGSGYSDSEDNSSGNESDFKVNDGAKRGRGRPKKVTKEISLPPIPNFEPMRHKKPHSEYSSLLKAPPLDVFRQFFPDSMLKTIVINTNYYAAVKDAGENGGREWKLLTTPELLIFIGICIYFGIARASGSLEWQWDSDFRKPAHRILEHMALIRFQQIKRFLHISLHGTQNGNYYAKLEPLLTHIRETSQKHYLPGSNVSIDEMMIRFSGRSSDTFRIKSKPTPEGFKILALCDSGYTWSFLPLSRISKNSEIERIEGLSETACCVAHLTNQLPKTRAYDVYMDNYFSSIPLFQYLRSKGIGACGTVRANSARFPKQLKTKGKLDWDTLSGVVTDGVLAMLWADNSVVTMLTTIHGLKGANWKVECNRRRPRLNIANKARVQATWGDSPRKIVAIPKVIDDYNRHMGGVDIADQRRSYYDTQIATQRTWMPMFFWLLDIAIVNSHLICQAAGPESKHIEFRLDLAWHLVKLAGEKERPRISGAGGGGAGGGAPIRVTKNSAGLESPLLVPKAHMPEYRDCRQACRWCREQAKSGRIETDKRNPPQSNVFCSACNFALCLNKQRNCFAECHSGL